MKKKAKRRKKDVQDNKDSCKVFFRYGEIFTNKEDSYKILTATWEQEEEIKYCEELIKEISITDEIGALEIIDYSFIKDVFKDKIRKSQKEIRRKIEKQYDKIANKMSQKYHTVYLLRTQYYDIRYAGILDSLRHSKINIEIMEDMAFMENFEEMWDTTNAEI